MHKLIVNELIKMLKKKSTIIATIIILVMCLGIQAIIKVELKYVDVYSETYTETRTVDEWEQDTFYGISDDNPDYVYERTELKAFRELGIEKMDDYRVQIVDMIIANNTDNDGEINQDAVDSAIKAMKSGGSSYVDLLKVLASEGDKEYTNKDLDNPITNQYQYLLDKGVTESDDKMVGVVEQLVLIQDYLENADEKTEDYRRMLSEYKVTKYVIEHDIEGYVDDNTSDNLYGEESDSLSFWISLLNSTGVLTVLSICMIVLGGQIVAREYSEGTIKFLLINPVSRGKIIISKYLTIMLVATVLTTLSYLINIVVAVILYGGSSIGFDYISYNAAKGTVVCYSALLYFLKLYAIRFVQVVVYTTMAFTISSLFKSTAAAVGFGVACMLSGNIISSMLYALGQDWGRFLLFTNTNLQSVMDKTTGYPGLTLKFAIGVIVVHMVVFLLSAYDGFVRREV